VALEPGYDVGIQPKGQLLRDRPIEKAALDAGPIEKLRRVGCINGIIAKRASDAARPDGHGRRTEVWLPIWTLVPKRSIAGLPRLHENHYSTISSFGELRLDHLYKYALSADPTNYENALVRLT